MKHKATNTIQLPNFRRHSVGTARGIARASTTWAVGLWAITVCLSILAILAQITIGHQDRGIAVVAIFGALALLAFIAAIRMTVLAVEDWEFVARLIETREWRG